MNIQEKKFTQICWELFELLMQTCVLGNACYAWVPVFVAPTSMYVCVCVCVRVYVYVRVCVCVCVCLNIFSILMKLLFIYSEYNNIDSYELKQIRPLSNTTFYFVCQIYN